MTSGIGVAVVLIFAVLAANLPFINERFLGVFPLRPVYGLMHEGGKAFWVRLVELVLLYGVAGGIARLIEGRIGGIAPQGWEFYAITVSLFIVLAYPGFVYRYLRRMPTKADD